MTKSNATQSVTITVDGGYFPSTVTLKQGVPATVTFNRISTTGCLDQVQFPDRNLVTDLPLNTPQTFTIDTSAAGEQPFSCGMGMVHGKVVVAP
ncbi:MULTISPECIES: cupredoxin domain-containing protein [Lactobacillaceae]|uniref:cupredoxin domain-containing protein n=1 Tax=Lactobacillaceae TaxID=33958 RepID=UPI0014568035|nr:cupredoxin domain-containing protein [Lactobacillus sp. HBUAS51381]NLR09400.1 cupredoxin domain-containing protein [Lactobacillus sp. HBUAS51381]